MTWQRLPGWVTRFEERHPGATWTIDGTSARVAAPDGAWATLDVPFPPLADPTPAGLFSHLEQPRETGVLLVRRGGFAVAHLRGADEVASKVGRRHVQGRTKAGGWSQQRFARRRDQQARQAFDAAADHAATILGPVADRLVLLVLGGDRPAVQQVLGDSRLAGLAAVPQRWVAVSADPRREALAAAVREARSVDLAVSDPTWGEGSRD